MPSLLLHLPCFPVHLSCFLVKQRQSDVHLCFHRSTPQARLSLLLEWQIPGFPGRKRQRGGHIRFHPSKLLTKSSPRSVRQRFPRNSSKYLRYLRAAFDICLFQDGQSIFSAWILRVAVVHLLLPQCRPRGMRRQKAGRDGVHPHEGLESFHSR